MSSIDEIHIADYYWKLHNDVDRILHLNTSIMLKLFLKYPKFFRKIPKKFLKFYKNTPKIIPKISLIAARHPGIMHWNVLL